MQSRSIASINAANNVIKYVMHSSVNECIDGRDWSPPVWNPYLCVCAVIGGHVLPDMIEHIINDSIRNPATLQVTYCVVPLFHCF